MKRKEKSVRGLIVQLRKLYRGGQYFGMMQILKDVLEMPLLELTESTRDELRERADVLRRDQLNDTSEISDCVTQFDKALEGLETLTLQEGGYPSDTTISTVDLTSEHHEFVKADVVTMMRALHVYEWDASYAPSRFGMIIFDGYQWRLTVTFDTKEVLVFEGSHVVPHNYDMLKNIMLTYGKLEQNHMGNG